MSSSDRKKALANLQQWNYECAVYNALWQQNQMRYMVNAYEKVTGNKIPPPPPSRENTDSSTAGTNSDPNVARRRMAAPEVSTTFDIPTFTTRIFAELIDFFIVFAIKFFVTNIILMQVFDIKLARSNFSFSYTFDELQLELLNLDSGLMQEDNVMQELIEIILIGGIHKLAVIILEMWFLAGRRDNLGGCMLLS